MLLILQIILAISLIGTILIQVKGKGFGRVWGGQTSFTRRGLEALVFKATFVIAAAFVIVSAIQIIL